MYRNIFILLESDYSDIWMLNDNIILVSNGFYVSISKSITKLQTYLLNF